MRLRQFHVEDRTVTNSATRAAHKKLKKYWAALRTQKIFKKNYLLSTDFLEIIDFSETGFWQESPASSNMQSLDTGVLSLLIKS